MADRKLLVSIVWQLVCLLVDAVEVRQTVGKGLKAFATTPIAAGDGSSGAMRTRRSPSLRPKSGTQVAAKRRTTCSSSATRCISTEHRAATSPAASTTTSWELRHNVGGGPAGHACSAPNPSWRRALIRLPGSTIGQSARGIHFQDLTHGSQS